MEKIDARTETLLAANEVLLHTVGEQSRAIGDITAQLNRLVITVAQMRDKYSDYLDTKEYKTADAIGDIQNMLMRITDCTCEDLMDMQRSKADERRTVG